MDMSHVVLLCALVCVANVQSKPYAQTTSDCTRVVVEGATRQRSRMGEYVLAEDLSCNNVTSYRQVRGKNYMFYWGSSITDWYIGSKHCRGIGGIKVKGEEEASLNPTSLGLRWQEYSRGKWTENRLLVASCWVDHSPCRSGWKRHENSCYSFNPTARLGWSSANRNCGYHNAYLVTVKTREEMDWIGEQIELLQGGRDEYGRVKVDMWHTSGHYNRSNNTYYWMDGTNEPMDLEADIWNPMQPASFPQFRQSCIYIWLSSNTHRWGLEDIMDFSSAYICEYELE